MQSNFIVLSLILLVGVICVSSRPEGHGGRPSRPPGGSRNSTHTERPRNCTGTTVAPNSAKHGSPCGNYTVSDGSNSGESGENRPSRPHH